MVCQADDVKDPMVDSVDKYNAWWAGRKVGLDTSRHTKVCLDNQAPNCPLQLLSNEAARLGLLGCNEIVGVQGSVRGPRTTTTTLINFTIEWLVPLPQSPMAMILWATAVGLEGWKPLDHSRTSSDISKKAALY